MTTESIQMMLQIKLTVKRIELHILEIPLQTPFTNSLKTVRNKEVLLMTISDGEEIGWSECAAEPDPFYYWETIKSVMDIAKIYLIPAIKAKPLSILDLPQRFNHVRGHPMAKAMIENALFDLIGKRNATPLYQMLGGEHRSIASGISIGIQDSTDQLMLKINESVNKKYHRIKIKIKKGMEHQTLQEIRRQFPAIRMLVDANSCYGIDDLNLLSDLDQWSLMMIEQPFHPNDLFQHARLQEAIRTPICLDESISGFHQAVSAIRMRSCRIMNIKQGRVGGLMEAAKIQALCKENGIDAWAGGMLETGIGRAQNLHLQSLPGYTLPGDVSETSRYFSEDIVEETVRLDADGSVSIPVKSGIGVTIRPDRIQKYRTFHQVIT